MSDARLGPGRAPRHVLSMFKVAELAHNITCRTIPPHAIPSHPYNTPCNVSYHIIPYFYVCVKQHFFFPISCSPAAEVLFSRFPLRGKRDAHQYITALVLIPAELRGRALSIQRR